MNHTDPSYILHHMGEADHPYRAVSPPIIQTSIFSFASFDDFREALKHEDSSYLYTRGNNPTVELCEQKIAALEHGERAKLFSSGSAAISASILSCIASGDHVVAVKDCYTWARKILTTYLGRFGVSCTFVDSTTEAIIEATQENTKVIYLESPTTFTFEIQNLREISDFAKSRGITTIIDNTWATPIYQNPIDHGIDIVLHSVSKYLGGNSDVVAGVVISTEERIRHIFNTEFLAMGHVPDPMMAWLVLRGMRTLHVRLPVHYQNALTLIEYLRNHDQVESVLYPLLPDSPWYDLASSQMSGGSGLFSFKFKTRDIDKIRRFTDSLSCFKRAVSWGGYESLVCPAATGYPTDEEVPEDRRSLIRLHAGLEDSSMLIADLEQAIRSMDE